LLLVTLWMTEITEEGRAGLTVGAVLLALALGDLWPHLPG